MSKFKTGDMVRILHTDYPETDLQVGEVRRIEAVASKDWCYIIGINNDDGGLVRRFFYAHELELVEPEQATPAPSREIKVGDTVERVSGTNLTTPIGFRGVVSKIITDEFSPLELLFENGQWGYERGRDSTASNWKIIKSVNTSPVIYETVHKVKIVGGAYGDVRLGVVSTELGTSVHIDVDTKWYTKDQLAKIIETLTTIHKAMEEGA